MGPDLMRVAGVYHAPGQARTPRTLPARSTFSLLSAVRMPSSSLPLLTLTLALAAGSVARAATPAAKPPGDLTGPWQLFIDDSAIRDKTDVTRRYHRFEKHPRNPVLSPDRPWEGKVAYLYGSVLPGEDGTGYRMWYHSLAEGGYWNLYATSRDGLAWDKPALGQVDFQGSKQNNIFFRRTKEDHIPQVIATPWESNPDRRYKLINYDYGRTRPHNIVSGFWAAFSRDGIRWTDVPGNPVLPDVGDVGNVVWDAHTRQYVAYTKIFAPVGGYRRRSIGYATSPDFITWKPAELILVPDTFDDRWVKQDLQHTDLYGVSAFPYESGYVGFLWIFRITDGGSEGPMLVELVSSRDGITWQRQEGDRPPVLELGPAGSWDAGMIVTPNHPLVEGDRIKLFYGGFGGTHGAGKKQTAAVGLATLRKDGFASLDAGTQPGRVTTRLLGQARGTLRVNASLASGWLKAEVLDRDDRVVPGYGLDDCIAVTGDGIELPVVWKNQRTLPEQAGDLRLRFVFTQGSLFSFRAEAPVRLVDPERPADLALNFEDESWRPRLFLRGTAAVAKDPAGPSRAINLKSTGDVVDVTGTAALGKAFTLAARVKTAQPQLARILSTHRGTGEPVTGELLFDVNPRTGVLRFFVNGQKVQSRPRYCADRQYHHYAVTYANGEVRLFLDGILVGNGRIRQGSAHLFNSQSVVEHFGPDDARSDVGILLVNDLRIGEDQGGRFITNKDVAKDSPTEQLIGWVDDVLIARRALSAAEIESIARP